MMSALRAPAFDEAVHPRAPAGAAAGGQFVSADAGKGESGGAGASKDKQAQVKAVQKLLGLTPTGEFTPDDAAAVRKYQQEHGLQVDGVVGTQTLASLLGAGKRGPGALTADDRKKLLALAHEAEPAKPKPAKKPRHHAAKKPPGGTQPATPAAAKPAAGPPAKVTPAAAPRAAGHGNPRIAELGRDFWEHGRGAAWIRWPEPGSTGRCHRLVMQHAGMGDQQAWGYCAERHHAVLGTWPGEKKGGGKVAAAEPPKPAATKPLTNKQKKKLKKGRRMFDDDATAALRSSRRGEALRTVEFELERTGDGLTLSGYAAVFDTPTTIRDALGDFEETIAPGAFLRSLEARRPVLMFEHGRHPLIGSMPLGVIQRAAEDSKGLHIQARLSDNWLIQPVRDAIRDGAVEGMSFRFSVPEKGDQWQARPGQPDQRTIRAADVTELGPVVFPAYQPTTASIRSQLEGLPVVELRECDCGCDGTCGESRSTDITAGPDTRGAGGGDPRDAGQRDAHPSTEAQARHRDLLMKGIIRA